MDELISHHKKGCARFAEHEESHRKRAQLLSLVQLVTFVAGVVLFWIGYGSQPVLQGLGVASLFAFAAAIAFRIRVERAEERATLRRLVHERQLARLSGTWNQFEHQPELFVSHGHPFSVDVDLAGPGSLLQRIDTTHTVIGARVLGQWLSEPAALDVIAQRQQAVSELADNEEFRRELEASAGRHGTGTHGQQRRQPGKLNPGPFLQYLKRPAAKAAQPLVRAIAVALPLVTIAALVGATQGLLSGWVGAGLLLAQFILGLAFAGEAAEVFSLVAARRGYVEAFVGLFTIAETASFESELLQALQKQIYDSGRGGTASLRRLDRWAGLAELRHQFPIHLAANVFLMWDVHVLYGLERWKEEATAKMAEQFEAVGMLEALATLANLRALETQSCFANINASGKLEAVGLAHPLLSQSVRVPNDLLLRGPGTAMILTGSNMAGKSTLLRALGLNVSLALAGGPSIARSFELPRVHLRASMRVEDSLQQGASYFHAELQKLRSIVSPSEDGAPLLVLLDELLRGTNAEARHIGARSILDYLVAKGGYVVAATHDLALSALEEQEPETYFNAHLTDVIVDGEMVFDYQLRPGPVQGSNALRLLEAAGIPVRRPEA